MEVSAVTAAHTSPGTASAQPLQATQETFLQLLIAQLEHQDPLEPLQGTEFTAQLAQFTMLEQLDTMQGTLDELQALQATAANVQAASLIGKEVRAAGNRVAVQPGETASLHYALAADSAKVTLHIFNASGNLVRTLEQFQQAAGEHTVSWNGTDAQGMPLPEGEYLFTVTAEDAQGNPVRADTFVQGVVEGLEFAGERPLLIVAGSPVDLAAVVSVQLAE
ncbi:MAG: hypothetical protein KatS3mg131_1267 [Candidatus Tectimicrobiota bacterium]|nr:MAG: hypothetical protein KatS3mg131_1267 [Candidatus Tectomicrobia bacterium]